MERIKIYGLVHVKTMQKEIYDYPTMEHLTSLTLEFLTPPHEEEDYVLPFVQKTTSLRKLCLKNSVITGDAIEYLAKNEHLKYMKLHNVLVFNIIYFRAMLRKLKKIQAIQYFYNQFTRLMLMIATLESIFEAMPEMPLLRDLKISVWQDLRLDYSYLNDSILYDQEYRSFKLARGNTMSFFKAMIPLVNSFRLEDFELTYFNENLLEPTIERASMKYNIRDDTMQIKKRYSYTTE